MDTKKSRFINNKVEKRNISFSGKEFLSFNLDEIFLIENIFVNILRFCDINEICIFERIQKKFLFFIRDCRNKLIWKEKVKYYNFDRYNYINKQPINLNICWRSEFKEIYLNTNFIRYDYFYKGGCYKHLLNGVYSIIPYGKGKGKFSDGSIYEGDWKYGNFYGNGKLIQKSGNYFIGNFKNGLADKGYIKRIYNDKIFNGEWKDGKQKGYGIMEFKNGNKITGNFEDENVTGRIKFLFKNGNTYEGFIQNKKFHGEGKFIHHSGFLYDGQWNNGVMEGYGDMKIINKGIYKGNFINGKFHGIGKMKYFNGEIYNGEWVNGMKNGKGKMIYSKDLIYEGQWEKNNYCGRGKITLPNKFVWEENFKNINIYEKLKKLDPCGYFYNNIWQNGNYYIGNRKNNNPYGLPDGKGICLYNNGDIYIGNFKNGKKHGEGKLLFPNGLIFKNCWNNGNTFENIENENGRYKEIFNSL